MQQQCGELVQVIKQEYRGYDLSDRLFVDASASPSSPATPSASPTLARRAGSSPSPRGLSRFNGSSRVAMEVDSEVEPQLSSANTSSAPSPIDQQRARRGGSLSVALKPFSQPLAPTSPASPAPSQRAKRSITPVRAVTPDTGRNVRTRRS